MAKLAAAILILFSVVLVGMPVVHGVDESPKAIEEWFQKLEFGKEKVTKLHFYFHDILSGKNATAFTVAKSNITSTSPTFFGITNMMDDLLTVGPEPNSTIMGRAQGLYGSAGLQEVGLLMAFNFVFTQGTYNGSTLSVLGRNPALHKYRELPIVGGSGVFRLARGIATAKTHTANFTTGDAIVEYHLVVIHY